MPRSRVFVSSVVEGYQLMREAARTGILAAGLEPVLANEDFPSLVESPRNACLDGIASCDIYMAILGARGGYTTPSGKTVVEEEFDFAKKNKLPALLFVEDTLRDSAISEFVARASEYVSGNFRRTFCSAGELTTCVTEALEVVALPNRLPTYKAMLSDRFADFPPTERGRGSETVLHVRICPVRTEELLSPQEMAASSIEQDLYEIGHRPTVGLFSYTAAKKLSRQQGTLRIVESSDRHGESVALAFEETGILDVAVGLPRPRAEPHVGPLALQISIEDMERVICSVLQLYSALITKLDPWERHQQFLFNIALAGLGYRTLVRKLDRSSSQAMRMPSNNEPLTAYPNPRALSRSDFLDPREEIQRVVALLERNATS